VPGGRTFLYSADSRLAARVGGVHDTLTDHQPKFDLTYLAIFAQAVVILVSV